MSGALSGQLGVVGLTDEDERAIGPFAYDHAFRPTIAMFYASRATVADASSAQATQCARRRAPKDRTAKVASFRNDAWRGFRPGCARGRRRYIASFPRRDGRVAEGARLESVYTGNRIVGSNPTPSANRPFAFVR